jgi:hypothetical protein
MAIKIHEFPHNDLNLHRQIRNLLSSFLMVCSRIGRIVLIIEIKPRSRSGLVREKINSSSQSSA